MHEFTYITAFTVGLMGGVHCVGMCGGIVGALSFAIDQDKNSSKNSLIRLLLSYNIGRLMSYSLAGGLMGTLGWMVSNWSDIKHIQILLQVIAAVFMLFMGLYISGLWMGLAKLEKAGATADQQRR